MSKIKLNSLVKNFGGNSLAVDNLSVTFPSGELRISEMKNMKIL